MRTTNAQEKIKLPEMKIPPFKGEYTKWMEFQDMFLKVVHNNKRLTETEKIRYLRNCLEGDAAKEIQHFELVGHNYDAAWQQLKRRFENKRIIIAEHAKNIFNSATMQEDCLKDLKRLHDDLKRNLWAIKT